MVNQIELVRTRRLLFALLGWLLLDLLAVPRTVSQWSELGLAAPSRAATSSSSISTLVTHVFSGIG